MGRKSPAPTRAQATQGLSAAQVLAAPSLPEASVVWLAGSDDYLREELLSRWRREVLDPGFADFNHQVIRCPGATRAQIQDALAELPVMTERRLLELRAAEGLNAKVAEALVGSLQEAAQGRSLVCILTLEGSSRSRNALVEASKSLGLTIDCTLDDKARPAWARAQAERLGLKLPGGGLELVLERTGNDTRLLFASLEKLSLYAGSGRTVSRGDIEMLVPISAAVQIWRLTAAVGQGNLPVAYEVLDRLLEQGESAGAILSYLNSYLVSLVQVQALKVQHGSVAAVARMIPRKSEFQVRRSLEEAATFTQAELAAVLERITRADLRIKTGEDPRLVLQLLLLPLCSRSGRR